MSAIQRGIRAYTKDGKYLGEVSELRNGLFKLSAPLAVDYWLPESDVEKVEHGSALLRFGERDLPQHRMEAGATAD